MTDQKPQAPKSKKQTREEKLAKALRENLRRRKMVGEENQNEDK